MGGFVVRIPQLQWPKKGQRIHRSHADCQAEVSIHANGPVHAILADA